jgi:hypothetical protein
MMMMMMMMMTTTIMIVVGNTHMNGKVHMHSFPYLPTADSGAANLVMSLSRLVNRTAVTVTCNSARGLAS